MGRLTAGELTTGAELSCSVDYSRRLDVARSHTVTHVVNYALQKVLGDGVAQKGSLADDEKLRFDFSHGKALTLEQLQEVETLVQGSAKDALGVHADLVPLDKAMEINGLRAVFGERYPDPVRVVSIGPTISELLADPGNGKWGQFSIELCGGTHLPATEAVKAFALVEETAVAKGVRRVVGVTGPSAVDALAAGQTLRARMDDLKAAEAADAQAIEAVRKQLAALKLDIDATTTSAHIKATLREELGARDKQLVKDFKKLNQADTDKAAAAAVQAAEEAAAAGDKYVVLELGAIDSKAMQPLIQKVLKKTSLPVLAVSVDDVAGKVACVAAVPDISVEVLPANTWLQAVLKEVDGRGGGKPGAAQGSGSGVANVPAAVETARAVAVKALG